MDQTTREAGKQNFHSVDSLVMQPRLLTGLERSLPSFDRLFAEYQLAIEEKNRYQLELEHETRVADDLQLELDYYKKALERKTENDKIAQRVEELDKIEETHKDLKAAIQSLEEKVKSQDEKTKAAFQSAIQSSRQLANADEQDFQIQIKELEAKFGTEVRELRENLKRKTDQLKAAKYKAEFEHSKRKEELRRNVANRMKSTSHHIECRSVELDLKKQIARLERDVKQLEQQRSRKKLPLSFSGESSVERTNAPLQQHPDQQQMNKRPTLTPTKQQTVASPPQNTPRGGTRKRKLFSVNGDFLDF